MSGDMINHLLENLSKKTGRQWGMGDLLRLAEKLPELNEQNIDAVLLELSEMGLELSEENKEKLKKKIAQNENMSLPDLEQAGHSARLVSRQVRKKRPASTDRKRK